MSVKDIVDRMMEGITFYINERLKFAPYDKTDTAIVVGASEFGYNVKYNGKIYSDVNTIGGICSINESVKILIPQNNLNNMFIIKGSTNHDVVDLQNEINQLELNKLDKIGDSSNTTVTFTESGTRVNIISGETLSTLFGKIKKWFTDLKTIAFTGNASDLTQDSNNRLVTDTEKTTWNNKSTVPTNHASIEITYGIGTSVNYGHVKLSDNYITSSGNADSGIGASSESVYDLYNYTNTNFTSKLLNETTYYVSTTGSDTIGDGTSGNPFATIQHAINILPKDLGGYFATINVASGTYAEDIQIIDFCGGGLFFYSDTRDTIADTCKVKSVDIKYCSAYVYMNGFNITTPTREGFVIWGCHNVRLFYCQMVAVATSYTGIYFGESAGRVTFCKVANRSVALNCSNSQVYSGAWDAGSTGNTVGLSCYTGATMYLSGAQPIATTPRVQADGGQFVFENGTQISYINSGFTCTWGTVIGGYSRNGSYSGTAIITVQISVSITSTMTPGTTYYIDGFPIPGLISASVPVSCQVDGHFSFYVITSNGQLALNPALSIPAGNVYQFSATYLTIT